MSMNVGNYDEELKDLEDQVADCLKQLDTLSGDARADKYSRAQQLMKRLGSTLHQFRVEVRVLEGGEKAMYEKKAVAHENTVKTLREQVAAKRNAEPPSYAATEATSRDDGNPSKAEARKIKNNVQEIQKATLKKLNEGEQTVAETEKIGQDAASMLKEQGETIVQINKELDTVEAQIKRAKGELNAFIRRMATDKIILCFGVLAVAGIVTLVALKLKQKPEEHQTFKPTADPSAPPPPPPPPPTPTQ